MKVEQQVEIDERRLARCIVSGSLSVDPGLTVLALRHIVDFAGVTLAGHVSQSVQRVVAALVEGIPASRAVKVLGVPAVTDISTAIFINAMAGHIHDFDDDEVRLSIAHTTLPVMASAWAVADAVGVSGETAISAYICGVETMVRLGQILNPDHYRRGWHSTATLGVFGSAAAAAVVLGATEDELLNALRFAASMAAGLRASFGSDGKPVQVAHAARSGYEAVRMAKAGLTSEAGTLFGPHGFVAMYGGRPGDRPQALDSFLKPSALREPGLIIKPYPCCTAAHTTIDAVMFLCQEHCIDSGAIRRLALQIGADLPAVLIHDRPTTGLQAKFSLRYCAAAAAHFRRVGIAEFESDSLANLGVQEMMNRVEITVDTNTARPPQGLARHSRVSIETMDGRKFECQFEHSSGSPQRPLSEQALKAKFVACAAPTLGSAGAEHAYARLWQLPQEARFSDAADAFSV
jgi:2-methylcitrate dehydratase PrpD